MKRISMRMRTVVGALGGLLLLAGCHGSGSQTPADHAQSRGARLPVVASGDATKSEAALGRLIALAGEWDLVGEDGKRGPGLTIGVSSAGSAVREVMFAGSPHEMTNMYHADGDTVVMTHYCAMGNQPRMRSVVPAEGQPFAFRIDSVTNLRGRDEMYMGSMTLTIVDANTIRQDWNHYTLNNGKSDDVTSMTFKRKGS